MSNSSIVWISKKKGRFYFIFLGRPLLPFRFFTSKFFSISLIKESLPKNLALRFSTSSVMEFLYFFLRSVSVLPMSWYKGSKSSRAFSSSRNTAWRLLPLVKMWNIVCSGRIQDSQGALPPDYLVSKRTDD